MNRSRQLLDFRPIAKSALQLPIEDENSEVLMLLSSTTNTPIVKAKSLIANGSGHGAAAQTSDLPRVASPADVRGFPAVMPLGQFLFEYLHRCGVRHCFVSPGDFALPTFAWLEKSKIKNVTMTHEPSAGFAADAYARINGIGIVCLTYCVGGLNVLNAIRARETCSVITWRKPSCRAR